MLDSAFTTAIDSKKGLHAHWLGHGASGGEMIRWGKKAMLHIPQGVSVCLCLRRGRGSRVKRVPAFHWFEGGENGVLRYFAGNRYD